MKDLPITTAVEHQEIAQQNEVAANSTIPLDVPAKSRLIVTSGVDQFALAAAQFTTQEVSDVGNAVAAVDFAAENLNQFDQVGFMKDASDEALLTRLSDAITKDLLARPAGDWAGERCMLAAMKGFRQGFMVKYDHLLTGMANSTAEVIRCLNDLETHLADHIAQQSTPKGK